MEMLEMVRFCWGFVMLVLETCKRAAVLILAQLMPSLKSSLEEDMVEVMRDTALKEDDYLDTLYSFKYLRQYFNARFIDLFCQARLSGPAPNPHVLTLSGERVGILSAMKPGRPLEYADLADFRIVYIREAHPTDGWAFRNNYDIK
nr:hypothetical protein BaRGS_034844 [Batillaria attramentaria]